jgi:hypothetical protein
MVKRVLNSEQTDFQGLVMDILWRGRQQQKSHPSVKVGWVFSFFFLWKNMVDHLRRDVASLMLDFGSIFDIMQVWPFTAIHKN